MTEPQSTFLNINPELISFSNGETERIKDMTDALLRAEIDTNIDPRMPRNGAITSTYDRQGSVVIEAHRRQGKVIIEKRDDGLYVNEKKIILYRSINQRGDCIDGNLLRVELESQEIQSASILDFLLDNREYIPEEWKNLCKNCDAFFIFFWATIYKDMDGNLLVRSLANDDGEIEECSTFLDRCFCYFCPSAVLVDAETWVDYPRIFGT